LRKTEVYPVLLTILIILSIGFQNYPSARASPSYSPGVAAGDTITYGLVSINSTASIPTFDKNLTSIQDKINNVNLATNTVNASLSFNYSNGTTRTQILTGTTDTAAGNLYPYILAGGLAAGDTIYKPNFGYIGSPLINETVNRLYAGAVRPVNVVNETYNYGYSASLVFYIDQATGFLVEVFVNETLPYPTPSILSLHFKATATNAWSPETGPDFTVDATPRPAGQAYLGGSTSFQLELGSINNFTGTIQLTTSLRPSNATHPPILSINPSTITLSKQALNSNSLLNVATNTTTTLGVYIITVNATSNTVNHQTLLRLSVTPPNFEMTANPANLTLTAGGSKSSTITLQSEGAFNGTVNLSATFYGSGVTTSLSKQTIILNSTVTSDTSLLTVAAPASTLPSQTSVQIIARTATLYNQLYIPVVIIGPDFTLIANPTLVTMKEGATGNSTLTLTSLDDFSGPVTLTIPYGFSPLPVSLSKTSVNLSAGGSANVSLTATAGSTIPPGYYYGEVQGTAGNGLTRYAYVTFQVTGPDFTFTISSYFLTIKAGQTAKATLSLSSLDSFSGSVQLSASSYGNVQASLTSQSVNLNVNGTVTDTLSVSASAGSLPSYNSVQVTATSGILTHTVYLQVQIVGPDFYLSVNPFFVSIPEGGSGSDNVSLTSTFGFTGNLTLSTQSPFSTSFAPNPVQLAANATVFSTLTIHVPKGTQPGSYYVGVSATNGSLTRQTSVYVQVIGPDFSITPNPSFVSIQEGGTTNTTIAVTSIDNFTGPVRLTMTSYRGLVSFLPIGALVTLAANSTVQTNVEIFANSAPPGFYQLQITGTGGNLTRYSYVQIQVVGPDFGLSANPGFLSLTPGSSGTSSISLSSIDGFQGNVSLSPVNFFGLSSRVANGNVTLTSGGTATTTLTVTVPTNQPPGYYQVAVNATSGRLSHLVYISVQVLAPDFSIQVSPAQLTLKPGQSAAATVTLTSLNGFNGTVAVSAYSTTGISWTFSKTNVTLTANNSTNVNLNVTASAADSGETVYLYMYGTSSSLYHSISLSLTVTGPAFSIGSIPILNVEQGTLASTTVTVNSVNNFSGNVSLHVQFLYSSIGISFSPATVLVPAGGSADSTMTIFVPSDVSPGFYGFTLVGTSTNLTRTNFFYVQVTARPYTVTANPATLVLFPGSSGNSTITITNNQFVGQVSLSYSSSSSLLFSLNPQTIAFNGNSTSATARLTVTVPSTAAPGFYNVTIIATSPGQNGTVTVGILVPHPDFILVSQQLSLAVMQGGSSTDTVTLLSVGGFSAPVKLVASILYIGGVQATLNPSIVLVKPSLPNSTLLTASNSTILTISASLNATLGSGYVEITATSNATGIVHFLQIPVDVLAKPDFQISASPASLSFFQGSSATSLISLKSLNGFMGTVALSATVSPLGPSTILANSLYVSGVSGTTLTVSAGTNALGNFTVTVTGSAQNITHTTTIQVHVAPMPDFTVSAPSSLSIISGQSTAVVVVVSSLHGFSGSVNLLAFSSPPNFAAYLNPATVQVASAGSANTTLFVSAFNTPPGQYKIKVQANAGSLQHSITTSLTVLPAPDFTLTTPLYMTVSAGSTSSATISIAPLHGFTEPVNFTLDGLTDFAGSFNPNPLLGGSGTCNMTITASSGVFRGNYTVTVVAISRSILHYSSFTVTVNASSSTPVTSTPVDWLHRISLSRTQGLQTWAVKLTNNANIPVYVQVRTAGSAGLNQAFAVQSAVIMILPKTSASVTLNQIFNTPGLRYTFTTTLYYSSVTSQSKLVSPLTLDLAKGSFTVGK
jgi:uncharacterized membrane protein